MANVFIQKSLVSALGMDYVFLPFERPETLTDNASNDARAILNNMPKHPLLLHCSSSNRVGAIWLAHRQLDHGLTIDEAAREARTVGLNLPAYVEVA